MKKIVLLVFAILLAFGPVFLVATPEAYAQQTVDPGRQPALVPVERGVEIIFNTAFWVLLLLAGVFFLMGAFYFLMGGQDEANLKKGKNIITYAIVALIIAIMARGLAEFVPRMFGIR